MNRFSWKRISEPSQCDFPSLITYSRIGKKDHPPAKWNAANLACAFIFFKVYYPFLSYYLLTSLMTCLYKGNISNLLEVSTVHQLHFLASCWHMLNWKISPSQLLVLTDQCECKWRKWVNIYIFIKGKNVQNKLNPVSYLSSLRWCAWVYRDKA